MTLMIFIDYLGQGFKPQSPPKKTIHVYNLDFSGFNSILWISTDIINFKDSLKKK